MTPFLAVFFDSASIRARWTKEAIVSEPALPFVFFAGTSFGSVLSGRTRQLAEALDGRGHSVVFVELPSLRNTLDGKLRLGRYRPADSRIDIARLAPLPRFIRSRSDRAARLWLRYASRALHRWIPELGDAVVVTSTAWWAPLVERLPARVRCYDYIDHIQVMAGAAPLEEFQAWDRALLERSDFVTTVSEPLRVHVEPIVGSERIHMLPNGVRSEWVDSPVEPVPRENLSPRPDRPLVGFLGALFEWIDVDLLAATAREMPDTEFVFVGPTRLGVSVSALKALPNADCLLPVPFSVVPSVIQAFDICLIPFRRDRIAECADPLKVYEYCSQGKPVVSTVGFCIHEERAPITVATTTQDTVRAIRTLLEKDRPDARRERIEFARRHTWERRADDLVHAARRVMQGAPTGQD